ncbi:MAG: Sec-independent protein translocase subunit TatA [Granulosicoccaceae bacterium]
MMPSVPQLLIVLAIVVLIFGAKRLKNLGGDLGGAVKGFKQAVKDEGEDAGDKVKGQLEDAVDNADMSESVEQDSVVRDPGKTKS